MKISMLVIVGIALLSSVSLANARDFVKHDIDYITDSNYEKDKDLLDIYMPDGADRVPVIVYFHGGALMIGSKSAGAIVAKRFLPMGIGVVVPNYRLSPGVQHPAHIQDVAAATAWVFKNIESYGGDPENVYVAGHSAGAYLAALLAIDPSHLAAHNVDASSIRGVIPISPFLYVELVAPTRPKVVWGENPADWLAASVTPHIGPNKGRMLLIYADGDEDWRKNQNDRFAEDMQKAGNNDIRAVQVPKRDHLSLIRKINSADDQIGDLVERFVKQQM